MISKSGQQVANDSVTKMLSSLKDSHLSRVWPCSRERSLWSAVVQCSRECGLGLGARQEVLFCWDGGGTL